MSKKPIRREVVEEVTRSMYFDTPIEKNKYGKSVYMLIHKALKPHVLSGSLNLSLPDFQLYPKVHAILTKAGIVTEPPK